MLLRTLLTGLCGLCLCAGLALRSPAAYAQAADAAPTPDAHDPLAGRQFDTQVGLRIEPPANPDPSDLLQGIMHLAAHLAHVAPSAFPDQNDWSWHRLRGPLDAPPPSPSAVIPQIVARTRVYTPVAADEGAYLAVCYAATADTLPRHCSAWLGPVKAAIPATRIEGLRWSAGSGLTDPHRPLAVHDEIQIRGSASGAFVRRQPFGTWWQRSTSPQIPAQPDDIETFVYLGEPAQWANPDVQALPAEPGLGANRRYLTPDDVGRYVRGCWWRNRNAHRNAAWVCTSWAGPVVATVHLPDEYRMEIVGVPSRVDVRGEAPVTWWRRPADDSSRFPTQVTANANPYTPAADDEGHYLRACHAVGADRACTRWLGPVLPPIPLSYGGDFPHVRWLGLDYVDRPAQRPATFHVGDHLTPHAPAVQPIPLAPNSHVSQPVWMVLVDSDSASHPQSPRNGHDRVLHVGPDFLLPRQYQGAWFRVCLYGTHRDANADGWSCSRRETILP